MLNHIQNITMEKQPIDREELIIRLIIEDYRFQQIIHQMRQINFHFDWSWDLMTIIAELMEYEDPDLIWLHKYSEGLEEVFKAKFWDSIMLRAIAINTYETLKHEK